MYKNTDEIFIISTKIGYIAQLRQSGPIRTPIRVPIAICLDMVTANIPVFEFDPVSKKVVELTVINLFDSEKFIDKVEVEPEQVHQPIVNTDLPTADGSDGTVVSNELPDAADEIGSDEPVMMMAAMAPEVEVATADDTVVVEAPVVEGTVVAQATDATVQADAPAHVPAKVNNQTNNQRNNQNYNQKKR